MNVSFAPLPELAPRKRRSTAPMGMAARAQLVNRQRRRQKPGRYSQYDPDPGPRYNAQQSPEWSEKELAEEQIRQVAAAVERERQRREAKALGRVPPDGDEDPFKVFGRLVKGASKQLWKKVAKKDGEAPPGGAAGEARSAVVHGFVQQGDVASADGDGALPFSNYAIAGASPPAGAASGPAAAPAVSMDATVPAVSMDAAVAGVAAYQLGEVSLGPPDSLSIPSATEPTDENRERRL